MKTSQLIEKLKESLETQGDLEICVPGEHYDTWNAGCQIFIGFKDELDVWGFEMSCTEQDYNGMNDEELYDAWCIEDRRTLQKVLMLG